MGHRLLSRQSSCPEATAIHILDIPGWVMSFDRTAPRRIEHATPSLSWSERHSPSFLHQCGRRIHRILTQSTIYSICSVLQEKVYSSRIAKVDELKTRLINQSIVDAAIAEWRRCLSACVRVSGAHLEHQFQQVYKFSYFVIYLPKVIKLMESLRSSNIINFSQFLLRHCKI